MDRITLLLQTEDLVLEAQIKGFSFPPDSPPVLRSLCAKKALNMIGMYNLETPAKVVRAMKRSLRESIQSGNLSKTNEANIVALYRAISDAPDDADKFADFALCWLQSKARAW